MSGEYRDELTAAHARIAELERTLSEVQAGSAAPWLRELEAKRRAVLAEKSKGMGDSKRRWKVRGIVVSVAMILAAVLALISGSWAPFLILGALTLHPGMLVIWALGRTREQNAAREIAKLDEKVSDVKRMASLMGAAHVRVDPQTRTRVVGETGAAEEADLDGELAEKARRGGG